MIKMRSLAGGLFVVLAGALMGSTSALAEPSWLKSAIAGIPSTPESGDATALVVLNTAEVEIRDDGRVNIHCRKAVKILKSAGKVYAALTEEVMSSREVSHLTGWLVRPDGKVTELDNQYVTRMASTQANGFYNDAMVLMAVFPTTPVGSTVGFEYDVSEKENWSCAYQGLIFQIQQPVLLARFSVRVPHGWHIQSRLTNCDSCKLEPAGDTYVWSAVNLAYRPEEPLMPSWTTVARGVEVNCYGPSDKGAVSFASWQEAARWASRMMDSSAMADPQVTSFTLKQTTTAAPALEKLAAIADFVRSQVRYVAVEIDKGRLVPRPAATTLAARFGDCKDKAALMRSMLTAVGIPSRAVLASVGHIVSTDICSPFQFNHCIVAIPSTALGEAPPALPGVVGKWFFFDPTDPAQPTGRLPVALHDSRVLVASDSEGALIELPRVSSDENWRAYRVTAAVTDSGGMVADVTIADFGNWAATSAYASKNTSDAEEIESLRKRFSSTLGAMAISAYRVSMFEDSTLTSFHLVSDAYVATSGDMHLLKADLVHEDVAPKLRDKPRLADIDFGPPERIETEINWHLGGHWKIASGADSIRDSCRAGTALSHLLSADSTAVYRSTVMYSGETLRPDEYGSARKFLQALEKIRDMKIELQLSESGRTP